MLSGRVRRQPRGTRDTVGGSSRLRVLALTRLFPNPVETTLGIFNADAMEHLAVQAEVRVVTPIRWLPGAVWTAADERALRAVPTKARYRQLEVTYPRYPRIPRLARRWHGTVNSAVLWPHVARIVRDYRPDVLLASWAYPDGFSAQRFGERLGLPVVIRCLGSDVHQILADPPRRRPMLRALSGCARIVTVSAALKRLLVQQGIADGRITVVYNGVDRRQFRPLPRDEARLALGLPRQGPMLLCVANLVPIKGHRTLLRAVARLGGPGGDPILALVGDGPLRGELGREAERLGCADRVVAVGRRPHEEIPAWMAASQVVCLASLNEGLPNVLVEALACGRPVVATAVGGVPELVTSTAYGRLVEPGDPAGLATALSEVLGRAWDAQVLTACPGLLSWSESTEHLLDVLRRACSR